MRADTVMPLWENNLLRIPMRGYELKTPIAAGMDFELRIPMRGYEILWH